VLTIASAVFFSVSCATGSTDFAGKWVLDLSASTSPDPMLKKRLGFSWLERKLAGQMQMEANYTQSHNLIKIRTRGLGFVRTDLLHLDNRLEKNNEQLIGPYTVRTRWSGDGTQLLSDIDFRTKSGHNARLMVVRQLANGGRTLIVGQTLKVTGDSGTWTLRRLWKRS
jgi:hypothetical protein